MELPTEQKLAILDALLAQNRQALYSNELMAKVSKAIADKEGMDRCAELMKKNMQTINALEEERKLIAP